MALLWLNLLTPQAYSQHNTPDYWQCFNREGGQWKFGMAPSNCDASPFGEDRIPRTNYNSVLFDIHSPYPKERKRYMTELYAFLNQTARYFIRERNPDVSLTEETAFVRAALATAHQESYWSHYRDKGDKLKLMRGDYGHGHGLMQVDDRWHYIATTQGVGWNLIDNVVYSLDEYYAAWKRAPGVWCVNQFNNWRDRSRAAYSAYNGGPSQICRWTNPNHRWARNDRGFEQKYDGQRWLAHIENTETVTSINIPCLIEGNSFCPERSFGSWQNQLLYLPDGRSCVFEESQLQCLPSPEYSGCLAAVSEFDDRSVIDLFASDIMGLEIIEHDPNHLCHQMASPIYRVGSMVKTKTTLAFSLAPGSQPLLSIPPDTELQILDFSVIHSQNLRRYYQIRYDDHIGFVYAGDQTDHDQWLTLVRSTPQKSDLPVSGNWIELATSINLRQAPDQKIIEQIPTGTQLLVLESLVIGDENNLFLRVGYHDTEGFIYGGKLKPQSTLDRWIKLIPTPQASFTIPCPDNSAFDQSSGFCRNHAHVFGPFPADMVAACRQSGGGSACSDLEPVAISDHEVNLPRWASDFFTALRGNGRCPMGTAPSFEHHGHCYEAGIEGDGNVYGPFAEKLVAKCLDFGGGEACLTQRWSSTFYQMILYGSDNLMTFSVSGPYCPDNSSFDPTVGFCANQSDVYGPFTQTLVTACRNRGGGDACDRDIEVAINGEKIQLPRWSRSFFLAINGDGRCPRG